MGFFRYIIEEIEGKCFDTIQAPQQQIVFYETRNKYL